MFFGIIIGFVLFIKFSKFGIYVLFVGCDCIVYSLKNIMFGFVLEIVKRWYYIVKWYLVVEFLLLFVSYFVLLFVLFIYEVIL